MSLRERPFLYDVMGGSLKIRCSNGCCCIRYHFLVKVSLRFGSPTTADIFTQDRDNSLHFSWSSSKRGASLGTIVATSIELHCSVEGAVGEGISLTEDQFEELQTVRQDISDSTDVDSDESNQELKEQIGQCNMPARTRCSRRVRVPARYHKYHDITLTFKHKVKLLKSAFEPRGRSCWSLSRFL